jgi:hypothetical protein
MSQNVTEGEVIRSDRTADGQRNYDLLARLARLFQRMTNAFDAERTTAASPTPVGGVEAVEAWTNAVKRITQAGCE